MWYQTLGLNIKMNHRQKRYHQELSYNLSHIAKMKMDRYNRYEEVWANLGKAFLLVMTGQRYIKINLIKIAIALLTIKYLISSMTIIALPSWFDSMIVGFAMAVFVLKAVKERFVIKEFLSFDIFVSEDNIIEDDYEKLIEEYESFINDIVIHMQNLSKK